MAVNPAHQMCCLPGQSRAVFQTVTHHLLWVMEVRTTHIPRDKMAFSAQFTFHSRAGRGQMFLNLTD